jgi:hypothetical protein
MRVETLYKTATPGMSVKSGEYYSLSLDNSTGKAFLLKELHGAWDDIKQKNNVEPSVMLSPADGYASLQEAEAAFEQRKLHRAKQGFQHCFIRSFSPEISMPSEIYQFLDADVAG